MINNISKYDFGRGCDLKEDEYRRCWSESKESCQNMLHGSKAGCKTFLQSLLAETPSSQFYKITDMENIEATSIVQI